MKINCLVVLFCFWACSLFGSQVDSLREQALERVSRADSLIRTENYREARSVLEAALNYFEPSGDCYYQAYCYLWLSEAIYGIGEDYQGALAMAHKSKSVADACPGRAEMPFYSMILQNLAVFYSVFGDFEKKSDYYRQAFEEIMRFQGPESVRGADAYFNLGVDLGYRGQWDKAILYFDTSLQIAERLNYQEGIASTYINLAYAYTIKEDYIRAIDYQRRSLQLTNKKEEVALGKNNLGMLYSDLGDFDQALENLEESLALWKELYRPSHERVLSTLLNIASVYFEMGDLKQSESFVDLAIEGLGTPSDNYYLKVAYHYKALMRQKTGDLRGAEHYARLAIALDSGRLGIDASSELVLAGVLAAAGVYEEALDRIQAGLVHEVNDFRPASVFDDPPLHRISDVQMTLDLLALKARIFYLRGASRGSENDLSQSLNTYLVADSLVAFSRRTYQDNTSRELLSANAHELYAGAIAAGYELYQLNQDEAYFDLVFSYSEKNKALLVLEKIHDLYAKEFSGIPKKILDKERRLLQEIEFYSNQLKLYREFYPEEQARIAEWDALLFEKRQQQEALLRDLRTKYPDYYILRHDLSSATPEKIKQRLLTDEEVLVEYFLTNSTLYIFAISSEGRRFVEMPLSVDMATLVGEFRQSILMQEDRFYEQAARLYDLLIKPVASFVKGKKLIIVPDGALGYLPFEALLVRPADPGDFNRHQSLPYLIRNHEIRYIFSASLALEEINRPRPSRKGGRTLVIAPEFRNGDSLTLKGSEEFRGMDRLLSPLPGSKEEISILKKRFDGSFWQAGEAKEGRFKQKAGTYSLIHITTHTLVNERFPSLSKLVFSKEPEGSPEDGFLNAYELFNLSLNADLIVLSACNTGIGLIKKGEGIASLARSFAYAGSPNLVMSLWPVKDQTTPVLMDYFYGFLEDGMKKGEALHQAKLTYLDQENGLFLHPYYWATFIYSGDQQPIRLKKAGGVEIKYLLMVSGILLLLLVFYFAAGRKGRREQVD